MKILLIRHGEPDYAIDSLTEKGWREAELLSKRLSSMRIDDFFVSPLGRAQDTARATLSLLNRKAEVLDWLQEFRGTVLDPKTGERSYAWDFMPQYWTRCPEFADMDAWTENPLIATGNSAEIYAETTRGLDALLSRYGYHRKGALYATERNTDATIALFCHFGISMNILSICCCTDSSWRRRPSPPSLRRSASPERSGSAARPWAIPPTCPWRANRSPTMADIGNSMA